jgi:simple sugar transport system permease protein
LAALLIGLLMGLGIAFISVTLKAEQGISGIGLYLFGLGMSELLYQRLLGTPKSVAGFPPLDFPALSNIEFLGIGQIFFRHNLLVYVAFALVPISAYVLNHTTFGLMIRAVGQNPQAADAMGVNVARVRYATVTLGGMMAGLAGASLSIALLNVFQQNLTSGLGFIAVALVYFGRWKPLGVLAGAMLFSFVNALQLQISAIGFDTLVITLGSVKLEMPTEFARVVAPYVITIIALVFASKQTEKPTALTKPFERGE